MLKPPSQSRHRLPLPVAVAGILGYAIGALPSAWLASRLSGSKAGLARSGTQNPGTYNTYRSLGRRWGILVGIADIAKGALAAGVGRALAGDNGCYAAASTSVLGHVFPVARRGGRGVATSWGSCLVAFPIYAPVDAALAAGLALLNRKAPAGTRSRPAVLISTAAFLGTAALWSWRRLPNPGGPKSGGGLFMYAAVTSAAMIAKWLPSPTIESAYEDAK